MRAEFEIRKISNGYIIRVNGKETFCDTPEAICGETSTWVLDACKIVDQPRDADADFKDAFAAAQGQVEHDLAEMDRKRKLSGIHGNIKERLLGACKF